MCAAFPGRGLHRFSIWWIVLVGLLAIGLVVVLSAWALERHRASGAKYVGCITNGLDQGNHPGERLVNATGPATTVVFREGKPQNHVHSVPYGLNIATYEDTRSRDHGRLAASNAVGPLLCPIRRCERSWLTLVLDSTDQPDKPRRGGLSAVRSTP